MKLKFNLKSCYGGFTIVELLVVIAIFVIFVGFGEVAFVNYQSRSNLEIATSNIVEAIRHAKSNASQVQDDSKWGIKFEQNQAIVFSGDSYSARNSARDQVVALPGGSTLSGITEIVFEKVTGDTVNIGTIVLTNRVGTKNITVNAKGTITY